MNKRGGVQAPDLPGRRQWLAAQSHAAAQGLAQVQPVAGGRVAPAASRQRAKLRSDLARQALQRAQLLRQPHLAVAPVQGFQLGLAAAGAAHATWCAGIAVARARMWRVGGGGLGRGFGGGG
ncbi:ABC-type Fe3+-siderophore transport system, permease component [Serpentinimonas raichei]|uniref:ABC-type Fe3+-siderophore transport system, permease component n=1 Tax=Serpentinimonas raichei TaxID=1458425 RepID=A0A060NL96_9BURK|nr:ABC-type Fe3+-siderophore transport system, permease component [Serpentinimonas raichei]